jgi:hypothetical protein
MASAIVSRRNDGLESWLGRLSLTARILAVNIFALIVLAGDSSTSTAIAAS